MIRTLFLSCFLLSFFICQSQNSGVVSKGKLDLRKWNSNEEPIVSLDGEWRFYWHALLQWNEMEKRTDASFISFSKPWNEQVINGKELPATGYATYALEVYLPAGHGRLAVEVPAVFNSHALWVNDRFVAANGKVGKSKEEVVPMWKPQTATLRVSGDTLRIVYQVSNFHSTRGGAASSIRLGSADELVRAEANYNLSIRLLILFFMLVGVCSLLAFFITLRTMILYFSGLAFAFALRFMFSDLYPYYDLGLSISWEVAAKIEYIAVAIIVIWSVLFISSIYPLEFKKPIRIFFLVINAMLILFFVFAKPAWLSPLLRVTQFVALGFLACVIFTIVKALIYERTGAWASAIGIAIFAFAGIYNLFAFLYVIELNRIVIHSGYTVALVLTGISLFYRTPFTIRHEESNILKYSDLYKTEGKIK